MNWMSENYVCSGIQIVKSAAGAWIGRWWANGVEQIASSVDEVAALKIAELTDFPAFAVHGYVEHCEDDWSSRYCPLYHIHSTFEEAQVKEAMAFVVITNLRIAAKGSDDRVNDQMSVLVADKEWKQANKQWSPSRAGMGHSRWWISFHFESNSD